ncbi:MAG: recombination mediator RecR [Dongiaceae bacterium]
MSAHSDDIERLIQLLAKLPGLGPRSAKRAALHLLKKREQLENLSAALAQAAAKVKNCAICGNLDTIDPCAICQDPKRDRNSLCVVEEVADLWALERSNIFKGVYHVLGGTLSALDGMGPEQLRIQQLIRRVKETPPKEIIMAMNATVSGQTTAYYVSDQLAEFNIPLTRLAHGVPVGGELDYLDEGTLLAAFAARRSA